MVDDDAGLQEATAAASDSAPISDAILSSDMPLVNSAADVPTIFADAVHLVSNTNGVLRLQFVEGVSLGADEEPAAALRLVATIAMPESMLRNTVRYLTRFLDRAQAVAQASDDGE